MAKSLKDILAGVKSSKTEKMDLKDLQMSAANKDQADFVAKHDVEKHDDRVGNTDDVYKGKTKKTDKYKFQKDGVYEESEEELDEKYMGFKKLKASIAAKGGVRDPGAVAAAIGRKKYGKEKFQKAAAAGKKLKESCCNHTNEGVMCEVHGEAACPSDNDKGKMEKAKGKKLLLDKKKVTESAETRYVVKHKKTKKVDSHHDSYEEAKKSHNALDDKSAYGIFKVTKPDPVLANRSIQKAGSTNEEIEYLDEKLTGKDPASKWIHDFVHSDNPKFKGKSTKERQQMALGAYYSAKLGRTKNEQADTSIRMPGQASATTGGTDLDTVRV